MKKNSLIGKTPLIKINYLYDGEERHLYAKLEYYNLTGSIKDRLVYYVMENAKLDEGTPLVEATSGNTGISLASYGARFNHPVYIFMPDFVSKERKELLELFGANVTLISREDGGFKECVRLAKEFAVKHNGYLFNQFSNQDNIKCHYNTTGIEIVDSLNSASKFVSGIGTGGTLIGTGTRLKERFGTKIIAIEPMELPILSDENASGNHKIDGIGDDFIPEIVDTKKLDKIVKVSDMDAINMALKLSRELGLGVGVSSGANFIGAVIETESNDEVVTIFPDDNKKYLSIFRENINAKEDFISKKIKLINYELVD